MIEKQVSINTINLIAHKAVSSLDFRSSEKDREIHRLHISVWVFLSDSAVMKKQIHCDRGQEIEQTPPHKYS